MRIPNPQKERKERTNTGCWWRIRENLGGRCGWKGAALGDGSFAEAHYIPAEALSVHLFDVSCGHTRHSLCSEYCFAMNVRPLEI